MTTKLLQLTTHPLIAEQFCNNQETRLAWRPCTRHRQMVMNLIETVRHEGDASIAILGAGNCNDLDLPWLAEAFPAVYLFDLDATAVAFGIANQAVAGIQSIHPYTPTDITGYLHLLAPFLERVPTEAEFEVLLNMLRVAPAPILDMTYDVVISDCILSQIISTLTKLSLTAEQLLSLTLAVRYHHLATLLSSLNPAGRVLFITDLVSSDTLPELPALPEAEWLPALQRCLQAGNFFTGLNPQMVAQVLQYEHFFRERVVHHHFVSPWRWDISDQRAYLVYACVISIAA